MTATMNMTMTNDLGSFGHGRKMIGFPTVPSTVGIATLTYYLGHPENALISCKKEILWKFKGGFILVFMFEFQINHSERHGALSN
jgi:hypothetical protein